LATSDTPKYGLIQIEPTSRCNLRCITCLRSSHPDLWLERDFPRSLFADLEGVFHQTRAVHLQGWGEPLLLDHFISFINIAKKSGCVVSFTSNGSIMDKELAKRLINSGVDGITFSMAGATAATQDQLRGKHSFRRLDATLSTLVAAKKKLRSLTPAIAVSYLLTPATVKELPRAVSWCKKRGVGLLAGVHLTHAASSPQQSLQLFPATSRRTKTLIRWAHLRALFAGVRLELPPMTSTLTPVCSKNPTHNLSIAADGSVSPCVFLNAPMTGSVNWLNNEQIVGSTSFIFGNINNDPLEKIWNRQGYRKFRQCFAGRKEVYQKALARVGYDMDGIEQLEKAKVHIRRAFVDNPVPGPCVGCAKINGY
jgi:MoaA/NifB/PqqE/SkfB family radical SAM enzyme